MLKKHKNHLIGLIQLHGLDVSQFHAAEKNVQAFGTETNAFVVEFRGSPLSFTVIDVPSSYYYYLVRYVPYSPSFEEELMLDEFRQQEVPQTIDGLDKLFRSWLQHNVKTYLEERATPDLWSEVEALTIATISPIISGRDTSEFSEGEKSQIRLALQNFQQTIVVKFEPSAEQITAIGDQLRYLSDAVDRLNRFDWRSLVLTTLLRHCPEITWSI